MVKRPVVGAGGAGQRPGDEQQRVFGIQRVERRVKRVPQQARRQAAAADKIAHVFLRDALAPDFAAG